MTKEDKDPCVFHLQIQVISSHILLFADTFLFFTLNLILYTGNTHFHHYKSQVHLPRTHVDPLRNRKGSIMPSNEDGTAHSGSTLRLTMQDSLLKQRLLEQEEILAII